MVKNCSWLGSCNRPLIEAMESRLLLSANVLTYHNDLARTGQNLQETILTPANVKAAAFGKLFSLPVDGQVYAQPLYMSDLDMGAVGVHNVVFVATEHDSVYAFDADQKGAPLWKRSFLTGPSGTKVTTVPASDTGSDDISPEVGITGTPVIDGAGVLYVVAKTKEVTGSTVRYVQRLHALNVATGAEVRGWPMAITASVSGNGAGSNNGVISFSPLRQNQRSGLTLSQGVVYIAWASHGDNDPYHGWIIGYDTQTRKRVAVFNDSPNGGEAGIWMSGAAPSADSAGNLYVSTGNGSFNANVGGANYGSSVIKLSTVDGLKVRDFFTPFNQATLSARDADLGSSSVLLLPDQSGSHVHEAVTASKSGKVYLLDRDHLGHFHAANDSQIVQSTDDDAQLGYSSPAYFNGRVYWVGGAAHGDVLESFTLNRGRLSLRPASAGVQGFGQLSGSPSISANGSINGIVWMLGYSAGGPGVLRAYSVANLAHELYDSNQATGGRDSLGKGVKFSVPTIANGKVYAAASNSVVVYGLRSKVQSRRAAQMPSVNPQRHWTGPAES